MKVESLKLGLIERLMKVQKTSTLERMEELIIRAEMEDRAEESLNSISNKEIISIEQFKKENHKWVKENRTK
ncbi:hypothetical protein MM236_03875 [Belliella sp. DSM 107340]|uniref:Uncharacterized protein n=1 Tax=Belliella calami TaxID=2923436 RepID=A0ABS9UKG1_9BACT|nr:hypothetical protein [Belliella calami]MCH7397109.1 hypothetical protein [Belliella calami]